MARINIDLPHRIGPGAALGCGGAFFMAAQDAAIKWLDGGYPILQIILVRGLVALAVAAVFVALTGGVKTLRLARPGPAAAGIFANLCAFLLFYSAVPLLDLTVFVCIIFSAPLFIALFCALFLQEPLGRREAAALAAGFGGVWIVVNPTAAVGGADPLGAALALGGAMMWALAMTAARAVGGGANGGAIFFYTSLLFAAAGAFAAPLVWQTPAAADAAVMLLVGVVGGFGQMFFILAYRAARGAAVAATEYSALLWAALWGWLFWSETVGLRLLIGAALIIAAGWLALRRAGAAGN